MRDEGGHAACVDAFLERTAHGLSSDLLLPLLGSAFGAVWTRTKSTLGEVTLTAIAERVFFNAAEKFPAFGSLTVDSAVGIASDTLGSTGRTADANVTREGVRFVLVEFLTVLGNLTAEVLTPELHAALTKVARPQAVCDRGAVRRADIEERDAEDKTS